MDISAQIEALQKEHDQLAGHEKDIHKRMVGIRTRIGRLKTVQKKAEEILNPESTVDVLNKITKE